MITAILYQNIADNFNDLLYRREQSLAKNDDLTTTLDDIATTGYATEILKNMNNELNDALSSRLIGNDVYVLMAALQNHVINYSGYSDINDWLLDNSISVGSSFAALSGEVGFVIESYNIK